MWLPVAGFLVGLLIGLLFSITIPAVWARYTAMAVLAALDSIVGATRAELEGKFKTSIFLSGFFVNMLLAGFLTLLGDRLGVDLSIAAIVVFGARLFNNLALIRRHFIQ